MMFQHLKELENEAVILKFISFDASSPNQQFIYQLFQEEEYLLEQTFRPASDIIYFWKTSINKNEACTWIIYSKNNNNKPCGFINFTLEETPELHLHLPERFQPQLPKNKTVGHIDYALSPEYRKQNIAFHALNLALDCLKALGIETIEAWINEDNIASEKLIQRFNFSEITPYLQITSAQKKHIKTKIYQHYLYDYSNFIFYVIPDIELYRGGRHNFLNHTTLYSMFDVPESGHFSGIFRKPKMKCSIGFERNIFAAYVGKNNVRELNNISLIFWKLYSEIKIGNKIFLIFEGIDENIGYQNPISGHMIAIDKALFAAIFQSAVDISPHIFTKKDLANLILDIDIFDTKNISNHPDLERKNLELLKN